LPFLSPAEPEPGQSVIQKLIICIIVSLPEGFYDLLYLYRHVEIDGQRLNNKARVLCWIDNKTAKPVLTTPVKTTRQNMEMIAGQLAGKPPKLHSIEDMALTAPQGDIPARLYRPNGSDKLPVLLYYHGGGYIRGSLESHDTLCAKLAKYGDFAVLAVDYRLAPEVKFPGAVEDAVAALKWVQENGDSLGLDTTRIAVGGDSSGGCLAAAVAQQAKILGMVLPQFQLLLYPTLDAHLSSPSHQLFAKGFFLSHERIQAYRDMYLNSATERDDVRASPLLNPDLVELPPALIITAGFDPLRDEAEQYAKALKEAGVAMGLVRFPGMVHGFMSLTAVLPQAEKALKQAADAVKHALN
jgi:acetyl esterase